MLGLAIDSAGRTASAALWSRADGRSGADLGALAPLAFEMLAPEEAKADQLIMVVEQLLDRQGLGYRELDVIAVNRGPGSFTGIRSAIALARGLALAAGLPVLGITSHQALFASLERDPAQRKTKIALDARRGEVYAQAFAADGRPLGEIEARAPALVAADLRDGSWRVAGSGAGLVEDELGSASDVEVVETPPIDARMVMLAAAIRLAAGEMPTSGFDLQPLYVRAPDAVPPAPLIAKVVASEEVTA